VLGVEVGVTHPRPVALQVRKVIAGLGGARRLTGQSLRKAPPARASPPKEPAMPVSINLPGHSRDFASERNTLQIGASPATVRDALAARVLPTKPAPRTAIFVSANVSPG
jgi:hypothetical protein